MPPIRLDAAAGLTVADVAHTRFSTFPASATLAEVTAWFASSASHRMALLADDEGRFAGSLFADDVPGDADPSMPAAELAQRGTTVAPDEPAARAEELALASGTRRVPVVDADGRLVGIVAVTTDLQGFCGTDG
jgi:CBS domain-containing protein